MVLPTSAGARNRRQSRRPAFNHRTRPPSQWRLSSLRHRRPCLQCSSRPQVSPPSSPVSFVQLRILADTLERSPLPPSRGYVDLSPWYHNGGRWLARRAGRALEPRPLPLNRESRRFAGYRLTCAGALFLIGFFSGAIAACIAVTGELASAGDRLGTVLPRVPPLFPSSLLRQPAFRLTSGSETAALTGKHVTLQSVTRWR